MEDWITRAVASLCATGSAALFWTFGVFIAVPWREGRLLAIKVAELQVLGIAFALGTAVAWGTLHLFAISDGNANPRTYTAIRLAMVALALISAISGYAWTEARLT